MTSQPVIIVIPVYTTQLNETEQLSLQQCFDVLGNYPKCFVKPQSLDLEPLTERFPAERVISFPDEYFRGIAGYNRLMMSPLFYEAFEEWKYLLIYQTDAWVFTDQLAEWCNHDYDYIAAPWIPKPKYNRPYYRLFNSVKRLLGRLAGTSDYSQLYYRVGNGGLSLRNTARFAQIAREMSETVERYLAHPNTDFYNEDIFWSIEVNRKENRLKIPRWEEALQFSFDKNPEECYRLNNHRLPFACHGWNKPRMLPFWKEHIPQSK